MKMPAPSRSRLRGCLATAALLLVALPQTEAQTSRRPTEVFSGPARVVLITVDTLRPDRLECYGYRQLRTPHINRLAAEGIRFTESVAQVPLTLPSHCSILTGSYPVLHAVQDQTGFRLSQERTTIAEIFKSRGFATAAFVSSFVLDSRFGLDQGFDHYYDNFDDSRLSSGAELERSGDQTLSAALAWLERFGRSSFFLWLHLYDPHAPYEPPEPLRTEFATRPYDGEVAFVDSLIGKLIRFFEQRGWYSESLMVFTADHGEDLGDHGENTHGLFVYDSTIKIPLILKMPHLAFRGKVVDAQVQSIDIAPTILKALSIPAWQEMQGRSLLSLMSEKRQHTGAALGETFYPLYHFGWSPLRFLRTERFKYIDAPNPELYDLMTDPGETRNLIGARRATASQLRKELFDAIQRFTPSQKSQSASQPSERIDQETLQRLRSLGYIGYTRNLPKNQDYSRLPDPKLKIHTYNLLQGALADEEKKLPYEVVAKLRELIKSDPNVLDAYIHLGLAYKRLKEYPEAIVWFKKALEIDPNSTIAAYNLAHSYALAGRTEDAVAGFRHTLRLDAYESRAHVGLGIAYQLKGDFEGAKAEYRRALDINAADSTALSNLGAALLAQGQAEEATTYLKRALEINPDSPETHNTVGSAYLIQGRLGEAATQFREAIVLNATDARAHINLGMVLIQQGAVAEAISTLKRSLQINPSSGFAHYLLGQAYAASGMKEAAEKEFQEARRLGYH